MRAALLLSTLAAATTAAFAPTLDAASVASLLSSHDMAWNFSALGSGSGGAPADPLAPARWPQGAYLGNGLLGAMATASPHPATGATTGLRLDIGRTDLWTRQNRQPIGYLTVALGSAAPLATVALRVRLANATLHAELALRGGGGAAFSLFLGAADPRGALGALSLTARGAPGDAPLAFAWTPDTSGVGANATVGAGVEAHTPWGAPAEWYQQGGAAEGTYTTAFTNFNLDCA